MPPPQKGKAPTKGAKQILAENITTVSFYRNMALGASAFYAIVTATFYLDNLTYYSVIFMNVLVLGIYVGCYQMMRYISQPKYNDAGQLLDPGLDLNMEGGMGEHVKDLVILCALSQALAALSGYFWLLLLLAPARALYLLWVHLLGPWFFQEPPQDTDQDDKKKRKLERKRMRC